MNFEDIDPIERLIAEQAVLGFREVRQAGAMAEHGRGLEILENATLAAGRKQMMVVLEQALKDQSQAEQKGGGCASAAARRASGTPARER